MIPTGVFVKRGWNRGMDDILALDSATQLALLTPATAQDDSSYRFDLPGWIESVVRSKIQPNVVPVRILQPRFTP